MLKVGDREGACASAPGIIAIGSTGVRSTGGGGAGGSILDGVSARGWNIQEGVVVLSMDVHMCVDQMVGRGIKGPCELVLPLLGRGIQVCILSGGVEGGRGGGVFVSVEGVH